MDKVVSAVESWLLLSLALAAAATLWLVVPHSYHLTRQVDADEVDLLQKALIACYSMSVYFVLVLPFSAALSILLAILARLGARLGCGPSPYGFGKRRWSTLRRVGLVVGCVPLAGAALGFVHETSETELAFHEVESSTDRDLNIVLIVIDTLRADHLGSYGHTANTTPFLDSLAREGVRFEWCHTAAAWTKPSVASILTSLYPATHGANHFRGQLPMEVTTVAEVLRQAGFVTYAYVANPHLKTLFNFDQGFDFFDDYLLRDKLYLAAIRNLPHLSQRIQHVAGRRFNFRDRDNIVVANTRILPWLERYHGQNFFMYLHYMDPHEPYSPPSPYDTMFPRGTRALALYDGEIRFLDDHLVRLFSRFRELGIYNKTLFIVTSDHGEAFGEHGDWGHAHSVYQEQLHVPLIVVYPEALPSGVVVDNPVGSIDIAPTILDFAAVAPPSQMEGRSLRKLMAGASDVSADIFVDHFSSVGHFRLRSLIADGRWKYILTMKSKLRDIRRLGDEELYDLKGDPAEARNLVRHRQAILSDLRGRCADLANNAEGRAHERSSVEKLDEATEIQLKALGYLE